MLSNAAYTTNPPNAIETSVILCRTWASKKLKKNRMTPVELVGKLSAKQLKIIGEQWSACQARRLGGHGNAPPQATLWWGHYMRQCCCPIAMLGLGGSGALCLGVVCRH